MSNSEMRRILIVSFCAGASLITIGIFVLSKHFDPLSLPLVVKQPKPPSSPDDCSQVRRKLQLSARSASPTTARLTRITALTADQVAVYRALLHEWISGEKGHLNVSDETYPFEVKRLSNEWPACGCLEGMRPDDIMNSSHVFHILSPDLLQGTGARLVNPLRGSATVSVNDPELTISGSGSVEQAVNNAFAKGMFSISEIVFDPDGQHALVSYSFVCGRLCGSGNTWLFEKTTAGWRKTGQQCGGWVS